MQVTLTIIAIILGLVMVAFGLAAGADPEGRGAKYLLLIPSGLLFLAGGIVWIFVLAARAVMS
ncbi:MAG: hypothetical protein HYU60_00315 [Magnetospirillum sp.]|nr:hypothetical protein [Magnetospirillum sp.]